MNDHPDYDRPHDAYEGMLSDAAQMLKDGRELMDRAKPMVDRAEKMLDRLENGWLFKLLRKFGVV